MSKSQGRLKLKPISKTFEALGNRAHFDVLVVGSGYGGAISACRLASTGKQVALLERGREILPGDYPTNLSDLQSHSQVRTDNAPEKLLGKADGLYDLRVNEDVSVIVGCGLGGTSLINANVALEIDERLIEKYWPKEFNTEEGRKELHVGYQQAREMLGSTPYPDQVENSGYKTLNKLKALGISAKALGTELKRPPINVNFKDQINSAGVAQPACNLCGDCCSGCNHGAKNTTLMNYLPLAHKLGAEIYTLTSVDYLERGVKKGAASGWRVHAFNTVQPDKKITISADVLILSAGTLGSTEIMLRSKKKGLSCSDNVGQKFSGNGDVLAFGYNSYWSEVKKKKDAGSNAGADGQGDAGLTNGAFNPLASVSEPESIYSVGQGDNELTEEQMPGPCITGLIDLRKGNPLSEAMVIEEGVAPGIFSSVIPPGLFVGAMGEAKFFKYGPMEAVNRLKDIQKIGETMQTTPGSMSQLCYEGAVSRTQNYLVMSVDDAKGELKLVHDHVTVHWPNAGKQKAFQHDNSVLSKANDAIQGQFLASPLWSDAMGNKLISVHPIGGCSMGGSVANGVVNHKSQVFSGDSDETVYSDLYICDGSIIPGSAGVNPLLTISALTERACTYLLADHGLSTATPVNIDKLLQADKQMHIAGNSYEMARQRLDLGSYVDNIYRRERDAVNIGGRTHRVSEGSESVEKGNGGITTSASSKTEVAASTKPILSGAQPEKVLDKPGDKISFMDAVRVILAIYELRTLAKKIEEKRESTGQEQPSPRERKAWALVSSVISNLFDLYKRDFSPSFQFTEQMQGFIDFKYLRKQGALGPVSDPYEVAYQSGKAQESEFSFQLTIKADDLNTLVEQPGYRCEITEGSINCSALSPRSLPVEKGEFHFLHADTELPDTWIMTYAVSFIHEQNIYTMKGRKELHAGAPYQWWTNMTVLAIDLYRGSQETAELVARGQLKLNLQQFIHQVSTFKTAPRCNSIGLLLRLLSMKYPYLNQLVGLTYLSKFAAYSAELIFRSYGGLLSDLSNFPKQEALAQDKPRKLNAPHPVVYASIPTADGKTIRLTRYNGGGRAVILAPGMGVNASSYATPTVNENLVEFLTRGSGRGNYDVWLLDYRASFDSGSSDAPFNIDDIAKYDWPATVDFIQQKLQGESRPTELQAIVHCVGSMSLLLSLLQGHTDKSQFNSVISSQLTLHPVTNWQNNAKADLKVAKDLENLADMFHVDPILDMNAGETDFDRAFDFFSYEFPKPPGEQCNNPVCNRVMAVYGPSYLHEQLNHDTHIHMRDWFKSINLRPFEQLSKMMSLGYVVDAEGNNTYLTHPYVNSENPGLQVAGLDLPITFIAGGRNLEFLPETSLRTFSWLKAHNSSQEDQYDRHVFADYGHMDCFIGKNASRDIFPYLINQLQRYTPSQALAEESNLTETATVVEE